MVPTTFECLGINLPEVVKGYTQWPLEGTSFRYTFEDAKAKDEKSTQYYTMLGSRGIYHKGWKANTVHPTISGWRHFTEDKWELFHVAEDRTENRNVADQHPEKLEELKSLWFTEAGKYFGPPIDDRTAMEVLNTPRPQMVSPRGQYIYYPHTPEVPEAVAVNIRGRSYKIAAQVDLQADASGVLFAHGHKFGGHALYIKDGKLKYVYNYVGMTEQMITSSEDHPSGKCVLGVEFVKEREEKIGGSPVPNAVIGTASLYINDKKVGELKDMKAQVGKFALTGEGLNVGRDGSANVTDDYPGDMPWAFSGGEIERVVVDVSGEPYADLEKEALGMMKRE
jgi:arylsulfatase